MPKRKKLRAQVYARDGYKCLNCGEKDVCRLTLDHILPKSKGGKWDYDNLQTLCGACNTRKATKMLDFVHPESPYYCKPRTIPIHPIKLKKKIKHPKIGLEYVHEKKHSGFRIHPMVLMACKNVEERRTREQDEYFIRVFGESGTPKNLQEHLEIRKIILEESL